MGGTPLPPFTDFFFSEKGVTDLGGTPPPFTDRIRKVVFEVPPYLKSIFHASIHLQMYFFIVSYSTSSRLSGVYNNNKNGPPYSVGPHYAVSAQVVTACSSLFFWPFSGCNQIDIPSGLNLSPFSYHLFVFF